jgi:hypothetical protein
MYCLSLSSLPSLSHKRGTTHRRPSNRCTLSLQCISMRPLHPRLSHGVALPVLARPLCGLWCSLRSTLARPTPAQTLWCSPARCAASGAHPAGTRLLDVHPDARPPNTRSVPASHLLEAGDGSEARHGATTSVAEHGARRNRRHAVGEKDGRPL